MALLKYYDPWLLAITLVLVLVGLFMVGSSTSYLAMQDWNNPSALYLRQGIHAGIGLIGLVVALKLNYRRLGEPGFLIWPFLGCVGLLVAVFAMPALAGAHRWIIVGPVRFQPSELVKLFSVLYMASVLARKQDRIDDPRSILLPSLIVVGTLAMLVLVEPDLGSAAVLVFVVGIMLFVAGLPRRYLGGLMTLGLLGLGGGLLAEPYRFRRIVDWLYYVLGLREPAYQLKQSLIAVGSGGVTGVGPGQSIQKAFFLPASHTDFIYSIIGEEVGLIGAMLLLSAFLLVLWRGIRTSVRTREKFGAYLAMGLTLLIVGQGLLHMVVCLGLLPTTGLTLPLISYGGSSLVVSMIAMGLLINVSQDCNLSARPTRFA